MRVRAACVRALYTQQGKEGRPTVVIITIAVNQLDAEYTLTVDGIPQVNAPKSDSPEQTMKDHFHELFPKVRLEGNHITITAENESHAEIVMGHVMRWLMQAQVRIVA